ncbi:MAG: Ig-like domain-containing protein [Patescibacteria group bacterium]|nr:Ig-like domain-containing protein [Patescibacteria group bacterium]
MPKKKHKIIKLILWSFISLVLFFSILYFSFVLVITPSPQPKFIPSQNNLKVNKAVEFDFNIPIAREVKVDIEPETLGVVSYENKLINNHLSRTIVFTPEYNWQAETNYKITLSNLRNALPGFRSSKTYSFNFQTEKLPSIKKVSPSQKEKIELLKYFTIEFDKKPKNLAEYYFEFDPQISFTKEISQDGKIHTLKPNLLLSQGTEYNLTIKRSKIRKIFCQEEIVECLQKETVWLGSWTVQEAPYINNFYPKGDKVDLDSQIKINFSQEVDLNSFLEKVKISPELSGQWTTSDNLTFIFEPENMVKDMKYEVLILKDLKTKNGGYFEENSLHSFTTKGPVKMINSFPQAGDTGILVNSPIKTTFSGSVDHSSAQNHFLIEPAIEGDFSWDNNTMIFIPRQSLDFNKTYTISLSPGIVSHELYDSESEFNFSFSTELSTTKLEVSFHRQEHNLSCEVATLVMALNYKGVNVGEAELINLIGFDPTPKQNGIWGNPHIAFVGDIDGLQPSTGYGVYWQPIAAAGQNYRPTRWFTDGRLETITSEIKKGNPVIIWGTAGTGRRIDWKTTSGGNVVAVTGEHTMVVTGFIGSASNPTRIIVLDPLYGEKTFSQSSFLWNWGLLNRSGVVVE